MHRTNLIITSGVCYASTKASTIVSGSSSSTSSYLLLFSRPLKWMVWYYGYVCEFDFLVDFLGLLSILIQAFLWWWANICEGKLTKLVSLVIFVVSSGQERVFTAHRASRWNFNTEDDHFLFALHSQIKEIKIQTSSWCNDQIHHLRSLHWHMKKITLIFQLK